MGTCWGGCWGHGAGEGEAVWDTGLTWVAMPAWSVPGTQSTLQPCIRRLAQRRRHPHRGGIF